ncbi:MAG: DUF4159 domain-containing protein [Deltaproteobacteria bacterium]|nr:DUF4159 domain-containing protein [Deltaproteobacteria bacterium]
MMWAMWELSRRGFLAGSAAGLAFVVARRAAALGDGAKFSMARLRYAGGNWDVRPLAARRLLWEVTKRTSIESRAKEPVVTLRDAALFRTPFLYLTGDDAFTPWSSDEVANLRRYLSRGGFLFVDDATGTQDSAFDASVRRELKRVFNPDHPLTALPRDHVMYKSFYLLNNAVGRVDTDPELYGVDIDERTVVVYSRNDAGGAWSRDNVGRWMFDVVPGGDRQREMAFRFGVNVVMYALCLDYKRDQVHVPLILKRRTPYAP